jgi:hypothetical protein
MIERESASLNLLTEVAPQAGFEPATLRLTARLGRFVRSAIDSYGRSGISELTGISGTWRVMPFRTEKYSEYPQIRPQRAPRRRFLTRMCSSTCSPFPARVLRKVSPSLGEIRGSLPNDVAIADSSHGGRTARHCLALESLAKAMATAGVRSSLAASFAACHLLNCLPRRCGHGRKKHPGSD